MKRLFFTLLVIIISIPAPADDGEIGRPRIGLVLSGGGAKGFAHIGTLKMLDSLQIPVDYIVGTSMGGIIGALYAIGYTGIELERLALQQHWTDMFIDRPLREELPFFEKEKTGRYQLEFGFEGTKPIPPSGLIYGQKILLEFARLTFPYEHVNDFDELPIPFRCVAVDLVEGTEVVLGKGSLARAMRATMAIPSVFSPVEWGDSLLVDGGLLNNLPVDVAFGMGADIVIAVDVGGQMRNREKLGSAISVFEQSIAVVGLERVRRHADLADIYIRPDLEGYTAADFQDDKVIGILGCGERAAQSKIRETHELRVKYNLRRVENPFDLSGFEGRPKIYDVQIYSQSTIALDVILNRLGIRPDDYFDPQKVQKKMSELRAEGYVDVIRYEVIPMSDSHVRLMFRIQEIERPIIHGISIHNNRNLPFQFIYRLIGFKPGERLDIDALNRRIMALYGLGYFETIYYDLQPVGEHAIHLNITVHELPLRRLRIGARYDDRHRLVGAVALQATNILIPGMRIDSELQFAGLTRWHYKAFYPSRALNIPAYPFIRLEYKDIPTSVFNAIGDRIAEYRDRSFTVGAGFGIQLLRAFNTEIEYHHQYLNIVPGVAMPDPELFPEWRDELRSVRATVRFDMLDNVLVPRSGILFNAEYHGSFRRWNSDVDFTVTGASIDMYKTFARRHTFRGFGFYGTGWGDVPIYMFFNKSRPSYLIGMQYDQLLAQTLGILRVDYRYEYKRDIFLKLMANHAFDIRFKFDDTVFRYRDLWGIGAGIMLLSPVGPVEFMLGYGDRHFSGERKQQLRTYVNIGYRF